MKDFWLEFDYYQDFKMKCSDDAATLKQCGTEKKSLNSLQGSILNLTKETLPSLNEGFFPLIWAGKGRRIVMLDGPNSVGSPMVTTNGVHKPFSEALNVSAKNASIEGPKSSHREGVWCTLPQEATTYQRHMLETPWKTPRSGSSCWPI